MKLEIKVPQLPESVTEAVLLEFHKKVGEFIKRGENFLDLETDKVVLEVPVSEDGVITEIVFPKGTTVKSGQVIAYLDTSAKAESNSSKPERDNVKETKVADTVAATPENKSAADKNLAMPAAKKIAADNSVDLKSVNGTGKDGRILKEDVLNKINGVSVNSTLGTRLEKREPMSSLRKKVAARLLASQQENAILTTFNEVDMKPIMDLRAKYKDIFEKKYGVKLGFMSFFVKAAVAALQEFPVLNAYIDKEDIVYHAYCDIGIAVSSSRGLVVPILRNAENMSLSDIELSIADFANKAKTGKLSIEEMTGGTFSITNGGTFGSMMSTPIINPPQSAILGMHAIKERAVVVDGQIVIRPMMYLALSYDHRLIDGKEAVSGLVKIKNMLEDPARLLLEI
jgi:2-oxoglutarate dehydrogenase E2 component (dihydrolipoamide succinyltransferase)